jgi:DNA-binding NarL/FixJ family response regulator
VTVRIMVVEDHEGMRETICKMIRAEKELEVVCEAGDGEEAILAVESCRPDVIVMDLGMPRVSGIQATSAITHRHAGVRVVALSKYADKMIVAGALQAGATGYVAKHRAGEDLVPAIHSAREGKRFVSV